MKQIIILFLFLLLLALFPNAWAENSTSAVEGFKTVDSGMGLIKMTVGLLFVLAVIFAVAWFFRRFGNFSMLPTDSVRIVGGISLGHRERVVVLQVGEEQVLIGVTPGRLDALHVLTKPLPVKDHSPDNGGNFSEKLQAAIKQWKSQ